SRELDMTGRGQRRGGARRRGERRDQRSWLARRLTADAAAEQAGGRTRRFARDLEGTDGFLPAPHRRISRKAAGARRGAVCVQPERQSSVAADFAGIEGASSASARAA